MRLIAERSAAERDNVFHRRNGHESDVDNRANDLTKELHDFTFLSTALILFVVAPI